MEQYSAQTSNSLKQSIIKINGNMKKEIISNLHLNFVPITFMETSSSALDNLSKRVQGL